ncbi:alpha/beta hydrolase [Pseudonocardiaceae bacterium YIM PH 21723]|nr:alpha/beta hydrolase [Pseudonocardiaceae bacterium YIM PH 21723]
MVVTKGQRTVAVRSTAKRDSLVRFISLRRLTAGCALVMGAALLPAATPAGAGTTTCQEQNYPVTVLGSQQRITGTLCVPEGATTIQLLVPGGTYNQSYWEYQVGGSSYREAMNTAGYATLNMDRLGSGKSSQPPGLLVTGQVSADAIHQVVTQLRQRFGKVILVGHSIGAANTRIEAATYRDVDGVVVTGLSHLVNVIGAGLGFSSLLPLIPLVDPDPLLRDRPLDPGYLTTRPGARDQAFHQPAQDSADAIQYDEAHRDVVSAGEAVSVLVEANPLTTVTNRITAPVLLAMGQLDSVLCGQKVIDSIVRIDTDCRTDATLYRSESRYYQGASSFQAYVVPGAGHSFGFHETAPQFSARVIGWARSQGL